MQVRIYETAMLALQRIVLINGETLAEYMIEHDVGVTTVDTYVVKRVDSDYFEDV